MKDYPDDHIIKRALNGIIAGIIIGFIFLIYSEIFTRIWWTKNSAFQIYTFLTSNQIPESISYTFSYNLHYILSLFLSFFLSFFLFIQQRKVRQSWLITLSTIFIYSILVIPISNFINRSYFSYGLHFMNPIKSNYHSDMTDLVCRILSIPILLLSLSAIGLLKKNIGLVSFFFLLFIASIFVIFDGIFWQKILPGETLLSFMNALY